MAENALPAVVTPQVYPEGTLRNFAQQEGWTVNYDPKTKMASVYNPTSQKTVTFGAGTGSEYGIGGAVNQMHTVADPTKLRQSLASSGAPNTYQPQIQAGTTAYQDWLKKDPAIPYEQELQGLVSQYLTSSFQYDPANDASFQQASKEITKNVMESMNARGLLTSTITGDNVTQGIAQAAPQYEQMAYGRYKDNVAIVSDKINTIMGVQKDAYGRYMDEGERLGASLELVHGLDADEYKRWSDEADRAIEAESLEIERKMSRYELDKAEFDKNIRMWEAQGTANNDVAAFFGVPVGTSAMSIQQAARDKQNELDMYKAKLDMEYTQAVNKSRTLQGIKDQSGGGGATSSYETAYNEIASSIASDEDFADLKSESGRINVINEFMSYGKTKADATSAYNRLVKDVETRRTGVNELSGLTALTTQFQNMVRGVASTVPKTMVGKIAGNFGLEAASTTTAKTELATWVKDNIEKEYGAEVARKFYAQIGM